jgi:hypothetical protein
VSRADKGVNKGVRTLYPAEGTHLPLQLLVCAEVVDRSTAGFCRAEDGVSPTPARMTYSPTFSRGDWLRIFRPPPTTNLASALPIDYQ